MIDNIEKDSKVVVFLSVLLIAFVFIAVMESLYIGYINKELDKAKTTIKQQALTIKYLQKDHVIDETL